MPKLDYDDKRLLMFISGCSITALIIGFAIGFLMPPSESKIFNQSRIQNFNKANDNILNADRFSEYSDDDKTHFITGYESGFQQGREHEISKYNEITAKIQEETDDVEKQTADIKKQLNSLKLGEIKIKKILQSVKSHDNSRKKNNHRK